ncbi:MAG: GreA/GreB family elongation factor [Opitutales bacterium]
MTQEEIDLLIKQKPRLAGQRDKLAAMQPGAYCMHRAFGFGKISAYDATENRLVIDFEDDKPNHKMDPAFCVDKLEILADENIIVRHRLDREGTEDMIKNRPTDLVAEILTRQPGQSANVTELEGILSRLLGDRFKKWWTATKKQLAKDPRIAVPSRKTDPYVLRDEPMKPEEEILEEFYVCKQSKKKILLGEKLYQISDNVQEIAEDLPNIFDNLTKAIQEAKGLNDGERLHGIWVRNDLARHLDEDPEQIEPTSKGLILEIEDLTELAGEIPNGYQKRFLDLISRVYPDDWQEKVIEILRYSSGKMTSESVSFLVAKEQTDLVAQTFRRWLAEQNMRGPVLHWIIKNRRSRKFKALVDGLIDPRFLNAVLYAIDYEALQNTSTRRIQLADTLADDPELVPEMLEGASDEEARDLGQRLMLNQGFEELTKKSILARFIKLYPSIQSIISGESEQAAEQLIVSQKSFDLRREEYDELVNVKLPENKKAIEVAKEHGDLKENSEYKMARQDNEMLTARKAQLEVDFNRCRVTDFSEANTENVGVGNIVSLVNGSGERVEYAILGAWDSAPEHNILSYKTPLGQALVGKSTGESAQTDIDGNVESWTIEKIERWVDSGRSL